MTMAIDLDEDLDDATTEPTTISELVDRFGVEHERAYGVLAPIRGRARGNAERLIARLLDHEFGDDFAALRRFFFEAWAAEGAREEWRRARGIPSPPLTWRTFFAPDRVTAWRVDADRMGTPAPPAPVSAVVDAPDERFALTDAGNAQRFVRDHGGDVRWVIERRAFIDWNDAQRIWPVDPDGLRAMQRAKQTARKIQDEAEAFENDDARRALIKFGLQSESRGRLEGMVALTKSEPAIAISEQRLDADDFLFACANGVIDLRTGELREGRREDFITRASSVRYDPRAQAPIFERFLREIFEDRADLIRFVRNLFGYCATGSTREHVIVFFHGGGSNGKSTLLETMMHVLGPYATAASPNILLETRNEINSAEIATLRGARLAVAQEVKVGGRLAESRVKSLTGGDTISARLLYENPSVFRPKFKLIVGCNHKPIVRDDSESIWRRIKLTPFQVTIDPSKRDHRLPEKLREEASGILRWLVEGAIDWQREGKLVEPAEVLGATADYRASEDHVARFVSEGCIVRDATWCSSADLYAAFSKWCDEVGEVHLSQRAFAESLAHQGFEPTRTKSHRGWRRIQPLDIENRFRGGRS